METKTENKHKGMRVKRFREAIGMKQETLAQKLGTSQQNISYYEKQEDLDDALFRQLAKGMGVEPDILKNFNPDTPILSINEMRENSQAFNYIHNFNPIDKVVELYERLLAAERDKVAMLQKLLEEKE